MMSILASKSQLHFYLIILCYTHPKYTLRCKSIIVNDCKLARFSTSVRENGLIYFSNLSNVGNGYEIKMRLHIIFHKSPLLLFGQPWSIHCIQLSTPLMNDIFLSTFLLLLLGCMMYCTHYKNEILSLALLIDSILFSLPFILILMWINRIIIRHSILLDKCKLYCL